MELHVYDFDGTLFRSPWPPAWFKDSWFSDDMSLGQPCVPDVPDDDWWIGKTVASAKRSIANQDVYAILLTGRRASDFHYRIPELLKHGGLRFDEVFLSPGDGSIPTFKARVVAHLIEKFGFDAVRMWDDEPLNLEAVAKMTDRYSVAYVPHKVVSTPHDPECEPEHIVDLVEQNWLHPKMLQRISPVKLLESPKRVSARTPKKGDCFEAAGKWILDNDLAGNARVVHGEVTGQGPLEGVKFGHAWIEMGNTVLEVANGNNLKMPKAVYYALGHIGDNVYRYTREQARTRMLKFGHYGPWELKTETGL